MPAHPRPVIIQPSDPTIKHIALTQGQIAIVDVELYEQLNQWNWCAHFSLHTNSYYAKRSYWLNQKSHCIEMHCAIIGKIEDLFVDHINGNSLDNRSINLRHVTKKQSTWNRSRNRRSSSGYRGIN